MHIILEGSGKMAIAVKRACVSHGIKVIDNNSFFPDKTIAIHFGSGRKLYNLIDVCEKYHIPIIQGSTKMSIPLPENRDVVIINAPNLSLPMIRFMTAFPTFARAIGSGMDINITESHQQGKKDVSGTARAIAKTLGVDESWIKSLREHDSQMAFGVPQEHLDGHAFHDFTFTGHGVEIKVSTKILGRRTYAEGTIALAQALLNLKPLQNGIYELKDILHLI